MAAQKVEDLWGLTLLAPYQIHKEIIINDDFQILGAFMAGGIISSTTHQPPQHPSFGDKYIVPTPQDDLQIEQAENNEQNDKSGNEANSSATYREAEALPTPLAPTATVVGSAWKSGAAGCIAVYADRWVYAQPKPGYMQWDLEASQLIVWDGQAWIAPCAQVQAQAQ